MKDRASSGRYARGQFGLHQNLILLASLAAFILSYYFGSLNDGLAAKRFELLKDSSLVLSEGKISQLNALSSQDDDDADFTGEYAYLVDYGSGNMMRGDIRIDEETISRSISLKHLSMYASANYSIEGSTMQYSDITGDRYLFSEHGSVIGDDATHGKYLEIDGDVKLFVETQYTAEEYKPLSKANEISLTDQIKNMSIWAILQIVLGLTGVGILSFILVNIFRDRKKGERKIDVLPA